MRRCKPDANTAAIVAGLRQIGVTVEHVFIPDGPDLLCGFQGRNVLLEVKNVRGFNRISLGQQRWHAQWAGQIAVVRTLDEAFAHFGVGGPSPVVKVTPQ